MTPQEQNSSIAAFAHPKIDPWVRERCEARRIKAGIGEHYARVSPSVFNTVDDIELFLEALSG